MDRKQQTFSAGYFLLMLLAMWVFSEYVYKPMMITNTEVSYDVFLNDLKGNNIKEVVIEDSRITFSRRILPRA